MHGFDDNLFISVNLIISIRHGSQYLDSPINLSHNDAYMQNHFGVDFLKDYLFVN